MTSFSQQSQYKYKRVLRELSEHFFAKESWQLKNQRKDSGLLVVLSLALFNFFGILLKEIVFCLKILIFFHTLAHVSLFFIHSGMGGPIRMEFAYRFVVLFV